MGSSILGCRAARARKSNFDVASVDHSRSKLAMNGSVEYRALDVGFINVADRMPAVGGERRF
jgi:hypothetical protein